jgi:type IV fimbrial biogenesis protein FimT
MTESRPQHGFTLIEALLVIVLLLIVVAIGVPSFLELRQNQQLAGVGQALASDLQLARTEAAKTDNPNVALYFFDDSDWCWRISDQPAASCNSCSDTCDIGGDGIVRGGSRTDYPQVVMKEELTGSNRLPVGARRGVLQPTQADDRISFTLGGKELRVWFTTTGRAQLCTPAGPLLTGVAPCA